MFYFKVRVKAHKEREREEEERDRETERSFHPMVNSPNAFNSQEWPDQSQEPELPNEWHGLVPTSAY